MASPPPSPSTKKSKGRQRVKMVRMEKDSNRQVTFSKRRYGLFKKANELCTLCGAEVAIIVFSPGRKAFSFGHPSVETILKRFILSNSSSSSSLADSDNETLVELAQRSASVRNLNLELSSVSNRLEIAKTRSEELNEIKKAKEQLYWWDRDIDELNYQQLAHLRIALEGLKKNVFQHGKNIIMLQASAAVNHFPMVGINYPMIACYDGAMFNTNGEFVGFRRNYY